MIRFARVCSISWVMRDRSLAVLPSGTGRPRVRKEADFPRCTSASRSVQRAGQKIARSGRSRSDSFAKVIGQAPVSNICIDVYRGADEDSSARFFSSLLAACSSWLARRSMRSCDRSSRNCCEPIRSAQRGNASGERLVVSMVTICSRWMRSSAVRNRANSSCRSSTSRRAWSSRRFCGSNSMKTS